MKHKNYILASVLVAGLGMGAVSCSDYLDVSHNFKDLQSLERIFSDKDYIICNSDENNANLFSGRTIKEYDEIVVKGRDLYDGKFI